MAEEKISMEDVVKQVEEAQQEQSNRVVNGTVIDIDTGGGTALVDIGYKSEGIVSLDEFEGEDIKIGDEVEVFIVKKSRNYEHPPVLSHKRARMEHRWETLYKAYEDELVIDAIIEKRVRGGVIVDISGSKGVMPASLVG